MSNEEQNGNFAKPMLNAVLSLFDGMSCGQIALQKLGIDYKEYYASEIDKDAMFIAKKNFPNIKHIGDVTKVKGNNLPKIDLLIGGSPCQNLSLAVINNIKHNKGLDGEKSGLFYEYLRLLTETKPKYFLLENVGGMRTKDKDLITEALGVEPLQINSNLFSAQDRDRYYWTNIPVDLNIKDKRIVLKDICLNTDEVDAKFWYDKEFTYNGDDKKVQATLHLNGHDILKRVNNLNDKSATLTCCRGGNLQKKVFQNGKCRKLTPLEYERLQTVPDNYTLGVSDSQRYNMLGNGWTVDVIAHIFNGMLTSDDKQSF
jgi:site-specific DNA-cytosine methylase